VKSALLERYRTLTPIRCRGGLHLYGARDRATGAPRVLVMAPGVPSSEGRALLGNVARVHRLVADESIPGVAEEGLDGPEPWVALECDAVADLESLTDFAARTGDKPSYEQGSSLSQAIMETMCRVHRVRDPDSGGTVCLGSWASANVLFSASGKLSIVGFGAGPQPGASVAPEVASGAPPTPGADVYALLLFLRAHASSVRLPPVARRVFGGRPLAGDAKVAVLFLWSNLKVLAAPARLRPDMAAMLAQSQRLWRAVDIQPDGEGFAAWIARAIAAEIERRPDASGSGLEAGILLGRDAEWLQMPDGTRHDMVGRRPLRRLLLALAQARCDRPGLPVSVGEMLAAGWPGESPLPEAGRNRVYVAVSALRNAGLGESLQRWDTGYRIDPQLRCDFNSR
jgi:hypothetical protein